MAVDEPDSPAVAPGRLPDSYDRLVHVEQLVHGQHNPRRVPPSATLRDSIDRVGVQRPLIVHPAAGTTATAPSPAETVYHITDGWQRYQAATALGWEHLPVQVYDSAAAALQATESASIVTQWSTYHWAQYCQSVAAELEDTTDGSLAAAVADRTDPTPQTVRKYLAALSLPELVHPLLYDGPAGDEQTWQALANYFPRVRQFKGLSWQVAARLHTLGQQHDISRDRLLASAAHAVQYDRETGLAFVKRATDCPATPMQTVHARVQQAGAHEAYLQVPRVTVAMSDAEKTAVMQHCSETRQPLSDLVETHLQTLADELCPE